MMNFRKMITALVENLVRLPWLRIWSDCSMQDYLVCLVLFYIKILILCGPLGGEKPNNRITKMGGGRDHRDCISDSSDETISSHGMLHAPSRSNNILNWQHRLCKNPHPITDVTTLYADHTCAVSNGALTPSLLFQPQVGPATGSPVGWLANPGTPVQHAAVASGAASLSTSKCRCFVATT